MSSFPPRFFVFLLLVNAKSQRINGKHFLFTWLPGFSAFTFGPTSNRQLARGAARARITGEK